MKVSKEEIQEMKKDIINKNEQKALLEAKINQIKGELSKLNEALSVDDAVFQQRPKAEQKEESIFDAKPGEIIAFNFQDVTIKAQRQLDDLFKITDANESQKLKEGDYIKIKGNDVLKQGKKFTFSILREIPLKYESNPLVSWRFIKNK